MSRTGSHLKIRPMGTEVLGVELLGDPARPEPTHFRVIFPGGDVDIARTSDGDYWIHVRVNHPESPQMIGDDDSIPGRLTDARLDVLDKHAGEASAGDFADPKLYHLAVRVARASRAAPLPPPDPPILLSTGRMIVHKRTGPDVQSAEPENGGMMTEPEWEEYNAKRRERLQAQGFRHVKTTRTGAKR